MSPQIVLSPVGAPRFEMTQFPRGSSHPFHAIRFADVRVGQKVLIELDRLIEIIDRNVNVETLHGM